MAIYSIYVIYMLKISYTGSVNQKKSKFGGGRQTGSSQYIVRLVYLGYPTTLMQILQICGRRIW